MAKGTNFAERKCDVVRGNRGTFILILHVSDGPRTTKLILLTWERGGPSPLFYPWLFIATHGQPILKERNALEIETVTKMENSLRWLLYFGCSKLSM